MDGITPQDPMNQTLVDLHAGIQRGKQRRALHTEGLSYEQAMTSVPSPAHRPLAKSDEPESCATDEAHPPGWRAHAHRSIAVDFDGVIHSYISPWEGADIIPDPPVAGAFSWLEEMAHKFHIIIFSTRCLTPEGCRAVRCYLSDYHTNVYLPVFGRVAPWGVRGLDPNMVEEFECTATKQAALVYLDDRAIRFDGANFPSADEIHQAIPWNKKAMNDSKHRI